MIAVIIHLRLKIDDKAKISITPFLFSCEVLPIIAVIVTGNRIRGDRRNIIKYMGASFCHVIRVIAGVQEDFLITEMNHEWNGTLATFKSSAEIPP